MHGTKNMFPQKGKTYNGPVQLEMPNTTIGRVVDMECALNDDLIYQCYGPHPLSSGNSDGDKKFSIIQHKLEMEESKNIFPLVFHDPVSISVGKIMGDGSLVGPQCMIPEGLDKSTPEYRDALVKMFWKKVYTWEGLLVTFNGRGYDIPILELHGIRMGLDMRQHFQDSKNSLRHRYSNRHVDLMEVLANFGAARRIGKLDWLLKSVGLGGKIGIEGKDVDRLWKQGDYEAVESYNNNDVKETYGYYGKFRYATTAK